MTATVAGPPSVRACLLTPAGRGAVAVVRVWGAGALRAADRAFRPRRGAGLAQSPRGRPRLGRIGDGIGDEVVALVTPGDPAEVEIQCHGGLAAVELVLETLRADGVALTHSTEWARHTAPSRLVADAMQELARAATVRTAELLLAQVQGALDREVTQILAQIGGNRPEALARLDRLVERASLGTRLATGWRVALAGRPNVGKSRLLNALAGFERAIVSPLPGTTRDVVTVRTAFAGWPVELADTAGLRDAADAIEAEGIDRARASQAEADLVLILLDRSEPLIARDLALIDRHPRALLVATKADLPAAWELQDQVAMLAVSAWTGEGLEFLMEAVANRLVPELPEPGEALPFLPRHVRHLVRARRRLAGGDLRAAERILRRLRDGQSRGLPAGR